MCNFMEIQNDIVVHKDHKSNFVRAYAYVDGRQVSINHDTQQQQQQSRSLETVGFCNIALSLCVLLGLRV